MSRKQQRSKPVLKPITKNQEILLDSINNNLITFVFGPAGTGKSWVSVGAAIEHVYNNKVKQIVITRPVVETGHTLGFLPGTAIDKIQPYMTPLWDIILQFWPKENFAHKLEGVELINSVTMDNSDIVRHSLVSKILERI